MSLFPDLDLPDEHDGPGRPLGRYDTPDKRADQLLRAVEQLGFWPPPGSTLVEPQVGGGGIARRLLARYPQSHLHVCDVNPRASGLRLGHSRHVGDWLEHAGRLSTGADRPYGIVCNPPFDDPLGGDPTRGQRHIDACFEAHPAWLVAILPLEYVALDAWAGRCDRLHAFGAFTGRLWPILRGVGAYVWRFDEGGRPDSARHFMRLA